MSNLAERVEIEDFEATKIWFTEDLICVSLVDGREIRVPLGHYPILENAIFHSSKGSLLHFGLPSRLFLQWLDCNFSYPMSPPFFLFGERQLHFSLHCLVRGLDCIWKLHLLRVYI